MMRRNGFGALVRTDVQARLRAGANAAATPQSGDSSRLAFPSMSDLGTAAEQFFGKTAADGSPAPATAYARPPWVEPPPGWQEFYTPGIISTPNAGDPDATVLTIRVPQGWDGVIKRVATYFSGGGFVSGDGSLLFRLLQNGRPFKNFDSISILMGTPAAPYDFGAGGLLVESGDVITAIVNNVSAVAPNTISGWFIGGYFYPRQKQ
jgi:hypothetical protein